MKVSNEFINYKLKPALAIIGILTFSTLGVMKHDYEFIITSFFLAGYIGYKVGWSAAEYEYKTIPKINKMMKKVRRMSKEEREKKVWEILKEKEEK